MLLLIRASGMGFDASFIDLLLPPKIDIFVFSNLLWRNLNESFRIINFVYFAGEMIFPIPKPYVSQVSFMIVA